MENKPNIFEKISDIRKRFSSNIVRKIRNKIRLWVHEERTFFIMSENGKRNSIFIVFLKKSKFLGKDEFISKVIRSCCGHKKYFLLFSHRLIV